MSISLLAGVLYAWKTRGSSPAGLALGGLVAGGACAFVGILVSYLYGDVPAKLLVLGTVSSMVTGAIGGWFGNFLQRRGAIAALLVLFLVPDRPPVAAQSVPTTSLRSAAPRRATPSAEHRGR